MKFSLFSLGVREGGAPTHRLGPGKLGTSALVLCLLASHCSPGNGPQIGSQTNWLVPCDTDAECDRFSCLCGVCTRSCEAQSDCAGLTTSSCVPADDKGVVALCGGALSSKPGLCAPKCDGQSCAAGQMCVAGVCAPIPAQIGARVAVNTSTRYQTLTGFGATLGYVETAVLQHPRQADLFDAMFGGLGLDVLRLRNRFGNTGDDDLTTAATIIRTASASLGRTPTVYLASWSPPATMKASGALVCRGNVDTCTLAQAAGGGFDYAGYGAYWRNSLNAYASAGVVPDYVGIQNNPDFVPSAAVPGEGCKFLPTEGTVSLSIDAGADQVVTYPGFDQAMAAVVAALGGLSPLPKLAAPEVSYFQGVLEYAPRLDFPHVDAIAHHFYGADPSAMDLNGLSAVTQLARARSKPLIQSEMQAEGLSTALLLHYAMVVEGVTAYLQRTLAGPPASAGVSPGMLVSMTADNFRLEDAYHAMRHYALHTDPGWIRVDATSDAQRLLTSAWLSPTEDALTIILVNGGTTDLAAKVDLEYPARSSSVTRTAFDGVERSAELGPLPAEGVLQVPAHSIATIALQK